MPIGPLVYPVTEMTHAGERRRIIFASMDLPVKPVVIGLLSFLPAGIITVIVVALIGYLGFIALPLLIGASIWLFYGRSGRGLRQEHWKEILNSQINRNGMLVIAGRPLDLEHVRIVQVIKSSRYVVRRIT